MRPATVACLALALTVLGPPAPRAMAQLFSFSGVPRGSPPPQKTKLYTWYNPSTRDHLTSSAPEWAGRIGALRRGYRLVRVEGEIFSPTAGRPLDTVPLFRYYHPGRRDHFTTSDPSWTAHLSKGGYRRVRLEGYLYRIAFANTVPLLSFWSPRRKDNHATSDPLIRVGTGFMRAGLSSANRGGRYREYRTEGYLFPPRGDVVSTSPATLEILRRIGWRHREPKGPRLPNGRPRDSTVRIPVILMLQSFAGRGFDLLRPALIRAMFGPASRPPSLNSYLRTMSNGRYSLGPVQYAGVFRENRTHAQMWKTYTDTQMWRTRCLELLDPKIDFARYDSNKDGVVDRTELVVVRWGADRGAGGQAKVAPTTKRDGVVLEVPVLLVAQHTPIQGMLHELMHVWGGVDLYGPRYGWNNERATLMAAMVTSNEMFHPDPWHAIQWGWTRPRIVPIGPGAKGLSAAYLLRSAAKSDRDDLETRPILLFNPRRGLKEYFLLEYRDPNPKCGHKNFSSADPCSRSSDNGVIDRGLAVWHVVIGDQASFTPLEVFARTDPQGLFAWPRGNPNPARWVAVVTSPTGKLGRDPQAGKVTFWKQQPRTFRLKWRDGSQPEVFLSVTNAPQQRGVVLRLHPGADRPILGRIDKVNAPLLRGRYQITHGKPFSISGVFPRWSRYSPVSLANCVARGRRGSDSRGGTGVVVLWRDGPLRFDRRTLKTGVGGGYPPGSYLLGFGASRSCSAGGNLIPVDLVMQTAPGKSPVGPLRRPSRPKLLRLRPGGSLPSRPGRLRILRR